MKIIKQQYCIETELVKMYDKNKECVEANGKLLNPCWLSNFS